MSVPIRSRTLAALFITCVVATVWPLASQTTPPLTLARGTRIRVSLKASPDFLQFGIVDTLKNGWLSWRPVGDSSLTVPLNAISTLEVSHGRHSHAGRGALIGGSTLGLLSLATFGMMASAPNGDLMRLEGGWGDALALTAAGTAVGVGVGALIGSLSDSERWQDVPISSIRVAPVSLNRLGVGVSLRL
jgi:hypothetical protein